MARVGAWMIAGMLIAAGCSDGSGSAAGGADAGSPLQNRDAGPSGAGHTAGRGAQGGSGGSAGRRAEDAGRSGSTAQAGSRAESGSGAAGAGSRSGGAGGRSGGAGGATAGGGGAAGTTEVSDACASDADCVMCTTPLEPAMSCCTGCPTPRTKARCEAEQAAAKTCKDAKLPARPFLPVCPTILCIEPGVALCENGLCVRSEAIR